MKLNTVVHGEKRSYSFNCGEHMRFGKALCFSHHIMAKDLEEIILEDIRSMAQRVILEENAIREDFIRHNAELTDSTIKSARKELKAKQKRRDELSRLIQVAYEDRVKGKMPEDICILHTKCATKWAEKPSLKQDKEVGHKCHNFVPQQAGNPPFNYAVRLCFYLVLGGFSPSCQFRHESAKHRNLKLF